MTNPNHPMQPVVWDGDGILRFKKNAIVRFLLDWGGYDLNRLAVMNFSDDDRTQFAQLIGYSVSGAGDLDYFDSEVIEKADQESERLIAEKNVVAT